MSFQEPPKSFDPYSAPRATAAEAASVAEGVHLASRTQRFVAAMLDGLFAIAVGLGGAAALRAAGLDVFSEQYVMPQGFQIASPPLLLLSNLVPMAVQWWLISSSGQSLGKKVLGLRIVLADGTTAGFVHGVAIRALPLAAIGLVPSIVQIVAGINPARDTITSLIEGAIVLADVLAIFGSDYRCVHDYMAGTYVVTAS